jgi:hypothetical protein
MECVQQTIVQGTSMKEEFSKRTVIQVDSCAGHDSLARVIF